MRSAHSHNAPIRIPAAALVELYRGRGTDEAIDGVLARGFAQVVTTGARMARVAGHLLANVGAGSGIIATPDPDDLRRLATSHPNVAILEI
jgi:hypothetical protein